MSHAMPDPEAALRRALHAAAAEIEPGDDGLDRIQRRLRRPRPFPVAWAEAAWVRLSLRVPDGLWAIADRLAAEARAVSQHFMPPTSARSRAHGSHGWLEWARPIAAMGIAVSIVTAVVYMAIEVPSAIVSTTGNSSKSTSNNGQPSSSGNAAGHGQRGVGGGAGGSSPGAPGSSSSPACGKHSSPIPTLIPEPSSSATSPSASPTPTTSSSPTSNPSPTPSDSSTSSSSPPVTTTSPADSVATPVPSASSSGDSAASSAVSHAKQADRNPALVRSAGGPASSPCPSASSDKSSTHKVTPDVGGPAAIGQLNLPAIQTAAVWVLSGAEVKGRVY